MGRKRKNSNEVRIVRGISVSPQLWERFKSWCRGRSMSEMIEMSIIRLMDEKNDVMSLTLQTEELRTKISTKRFEHKKIQAELENEEHNLAVLEDRLTEIRTSDKAIEVQAIRDRDWMVAYKSDKFHSLKRSFGRWVEKGDDFARLMPSIDTVKERTNYLDNMNTTETEMAWIALKYPEDAWQFWLKERRVI
jgi:hypothetical protein